MTLNFVATEEALRTGVVGRVLDRDLVWVDGPDAMSYLQGQVSQDLGPLGVGDSAEALILTPQGKLDAYVRVVRAGEERYGVEVAAGYGEAVLERLRRFKIRIQATLELAATRLVEVRGPDAVIPAVLADGVIALPFAFRSLVGYDLLGDSAELPDGVGVADDGAFEVARILAGVPAMGSELTEKTIAAEAGLVGRTVSFTKGCYTGQELVARLDARGNRVPWNLRLIEIDGPLGEGDATLTVDGTEVGRITSAAYSPILGGSVALGYLKRDFSTPGTVAVDSSTGVLTAAVKALPDD